MIRDVRPAPEPLALADSAHRPGPAVGPTVAFHSFGCKLNQCETAGIRSRFVEAGFAAVSVLDTGSASMDGRGGHASGGASGLAVADIHVVNTCSVTGRADAQARQLIRKLIRQQPGSRVVVTGCYAQRAPEEIARIPGVFLVAGNGEKDRLPELVGEMLAAEARKQVEVIPAPTAHAGPAQAAAPPAHTGVARVAVSDLRKVQRSFELEPVEFADRTRAFLRVQDGCDAGCTFCIIPRIRGRSTSLKMDKAVERVRMLIDAGYREIILTGIHLGMYGHDRPGEMSSLAGLVDAIHELPGKVRLRLSSIEPQEIDEALIDRINAGKVVPHLHIPLQSGSDPILAAMNRTYRADDYDAVLRRLTDRIDPIGLGADVIVGFPGETEEHFEATHDFIARRPFTYLHVFPFSPRPGTRAASLPGRPPGHVVEERSARLRALSDEKRRAFAARFMGREVEVLVEQPATGEPWEGWSEHYVRVKWLADAPEIRRGMVVRCRIDGRDVGLAPDGFGRYGSGPP